MIRFGPSGNSDIFYAQGHSSTVEAPAWLSALGLNAFEYSFGRGVRLKAETALAISQQAQRHDIQLSVHMPYFINLAVTEPEKREKNIGYFMDSLAAAKPLGAVRAVFHPGSASGGNREEILLRAKNFLSEIILKVDAAGFGDITLCPETMGKLNQLGSLEEVIELCTVDERLIPTIDFGHLYCRSFGALETKADYAAVLDKLENGIGYDRTHKIHIHFSRMEYTKGGEKMHHRLEDTQYGPEFQPLAQLLMERQMEPVVICESKGTMAEDAARLKAMYEKEKPC